MVPLVSLGWPKLSWVLIIVSVVLLHSWLPFRIKAVETRNYNGDCRWEFPNIGDPNIVP